MLTRGDEMSGSGVIDPDMTPMIDVAFQLVTFFMIVTNLDQSSVDDRVRLPSDVLARPPKAAVQHGFLVNLGYPLKNDGTRASKEPMVLLTGDPPTMEISVFGRGLKDEMKRAKARDEKAAAETVMQIRAGNDVPIGKIQDLIRLAQEAGYQKFAFRAQTPE